jgi:undecaprenyl-diphosphatase
MHSLRHLTKNRKIVSKCMLALLLILLCLASFLADNVVASAFESLHSRFFNNIAFVLNRVGDWPFHTVLGLLAAGVAWSLRRKALTRLLLAMVLASTMAGITINVVRVAAGRPRPSTQAQDGFYGLQKDGKWIFGSSRYQSFPSAHTATSVAFAGVALFAGLRCGWLIALFGPLVGCARIYSGAHHFSDVVTATVIGLLIARWAWKLTERRWPLKLGEPCPQGPQ